MLYRHQEVLQVLYDNPKGLTTGDIYNIAKKKLGSELPDSSTVGKLVYAMRNGTPKLISTHDAAGGNIHTLTPAGKAALQQALKDQGEELTLPHNQTKDIPEMAENNQTPQIENVIFDLSNELDNALHTIVNLLREADASPGISIEQKAEKLALLESYETDTRLGGTTRALFASLRQDIAELDAAE